MMNSIKQFLIAILICGISLAFSYSIVSIALGLFTKGFAVFTLALMAMFILLVIDLVFKKYAR